MSATQPGSSGYITRAPRSSGLAAVLEILLDRGLVIDAFVRVSLIGIELLTVDLRVVIASVDTYLRSSPKPSTGSTSARPTIRGASDVSARKKRS
jgi:Gas vesicle protein